MITVLMTTYNCAPYIYQAVNSILNQTFNDFEYLIIDDGSEDETEKIVNSINDNRIRYIKVNHIGRGAALNFGLKESGHDWIALQDADDMSHPLRLEKQLRYLKNDSTMTIFSNVAYFKENKILLVATSNPDPVSIKRSLVLHGPFYNATMLFNKNHILQMGGYDESLKANEDHELWLRIKDKSNFQPLSEILYFVRLRNDSLSNNPEITYEIQEPYFNDLAKTLCIYSISEQKKIRGWREFFYGDKNIARKEWKKIPIYKWNCKILFAYLISLAPHKVYLTIRSKRIRFRIQYAFERFFKYRFLQKEFQQILVGQNK